MTKKVVVFLILFIFFSGCSYIENYNIRSTVVTIQKIVKNSSADYIVKVSNKIKNIVLHFIENNVETIKNKFFISDTDKQNEYETTQLKKTKDTLVNLNQEILEQIYYNDIQKEYFKSIFINSNNGPEFINNIGIPVYYKNPYQELINKLEIKKTFQFTSKSISNTRFSKEIEYKLKQFVFIYEKDGFFVFFTLVNKSGEYNLIAELNDKKLQEIVQKPYIIFKRNEIKKKIFTLFLYIPLSNFSKEMVVGYYRKQNLVVFLPYLVSFGIALLLFGLLLIMLVGTYIRSISRKKIMLQSEKNFILEKNTNKLVYEPKSSIIKNHGDNDKELNTVAFDKGQIYNNTNDISLVEINEELSEFKEAEDNTIKYKNITDNNEVEEVTINDIPPFQ